MEPMQIIWLVLVVAFLVLEAFTVALVGVWFCVGAIVSLLIALVAPGAVGLQIGAFLLVSILMLLLLRPIVRKLSVQKDVPTNADANIGKKAQVVTEVQPGRVGRVKLEGLEWAAKSEAVLPVGSWCRVLAIEGVKLVVAPLNGQEEG